MTNLSAHFNCVRSAETQTRALLDVVDSFGKLMRESSLKKRFYKNILPSRTIWHNNVILLIVTLIAYKVLGSIQYAGFQKVGTLRKMETKTKRIDLHISKNVISFTEEHWNVKFWKWDILLFHEKILAHLNLMSATWHKEISSTM